LHYRVLAQPLTGGQGSLIVAIPLTEVDQTLGRLLLIAGAVTGGVVVVLGLLSWWLVRRELRPLEEIGDTAGAIAAGDLSQRVAQEDPRTEVGRLGLALNAMLAQIEQAFAERKASEERLRRFLADASHELRTPLTSIRGYAELFRRGANERQEDLRKSMRRIEEESARMGVLVEDLLLIARLDQDRPLEREHLDLAKLAGDSVADARAADPLRKIGLDASVPVVVFADEARLRQVAGNLLANAQVHTPPGTPVTVRVIAEDGNAVLEVADGGPGLSPEQVERAFEPFYRSDPSRDRATGGAGLGLAIVAAIAWAGANAYRIIKEYVDDAISGNPVEERHRIVAVVEGADIDVVDVEQQPASGAARQFGQEFPFRHFGIVELDVGRDILEHDGAAEKVLHQLDAADDVIEGLAGVGDRQ
jgi:two-component system OmpR family sensor kinase